MLDKEACDAEMSLSKIKDELDAPSEREARRYCDRVWC